jgi:hypothetical protein
LKLGWPREDAVPTPAARQSNAAVAASELDPAQVHEAVLNDELAKGTDPRIAEARAKAAEMRVREGEALASAAAAPPAAAAAPAVPAVEALAAPAAAAAPAAGPASASVSDEELPR